MFGMSTTGRSLGADGAGGAISAAASADGTAGRRNMMRAGRMLATGDLRLIALGLIAEQPRRLRDHQGAGGQDRGLVLAEPRRGVSDADLPGRAGYVTAQTEGASSTITEEAARISQRTRPRRAVLERMAALGESPACAALPDAETMRTSIADLAAGARRIRQSPHRRAAADRRRGCGSQVVSAGARRAGSAELSAIFVIAVIRPALSRRIAPPTWPLPGRCRPHTLRGWSQRVAALVRSLFTSSFGQLAQFGVSLSLIGREVPAGASRP